MKYIILICMIHVKQSFPQELTFPSHVDLQKVGDTLFDKDKYNVLKPSTHVISDYFKDFVLNKEKYTDPTERVFIDDNGLRHKWTGFENRVISLRKMHVKNRIFKNILLLNQKDDLRRKTDATTAKPAGKERTIAKTTFFCPYLGVVTMASYLD